MSKLSDYIGSGKKVKLSGSVGSVIRSEVFKTCTQEQVEAATGSDVVQMQGLWVHYSVHRAWIAVGITPMDLTVLNKAIGSGLSLAQRIKAFFLRAATINEIQKRLFSEVLRQAEIKLSSPINFVERNGLFGYDVRVLISYAPDDKSGSTVSETSEPVSVSPKPTSSRGSSFKAGVVGAAAGVVIGSEIADDDIEDCIADAVESVADDFLGFDSDCSSGFDSDCSSGFDSGFDGD